MNTIPAPALLIARYAVFSLFALSALVALGSWLVRTRRISPFSAFGRGLRAATDPIVRPVEKRLVRLGGNPVNAGWWLVVVVAAGGVIFISLLGWGLNAFQDVEGATSSGPRASLGLVVDIAYNILFYAVIIRIIGSWLGFFRYNRWMRPIYTLTDWLIEPIRRVVPPVGMFDLSPIVAIVVLMVLRWLLLKGVGNA
jgi:YggT family protein